MVDSEYLIKAISSGISAFGVMLWTGIFFHSIVDRYIMVSQGRADEQKILSDGEIIMSLCGVVAFICLLTVSLASFFVIATPTIRPATGLSLPMTIRMLLITVEVLFNCLGMVWLVTIVRFNKARSKRGRRAEDAPLRTAPNV